MDAGLFLTNLKAPPVLFFFLGAAAALLRSDLQIPQSIARFLSLYLLLAIGFKGGVALADADLSLQLLLSLAAAVGLACLIPVLAFLLLRRRLGAADAAGIAATYGSVSAVTFISTTAYLDLLGVAWSGHLVAALALMESPAIIIGILLFNLYGRTEMVGSTAAGSTTSTASGVHWQELLRDAFLNGSVFLILGSLLIGWISGSEGMTSVAPFTSEIFTGMLCLFLLDMGILAARRLDDLRRSGGVLVGFALGFPLLCAGLGMATAWLLGLDEGDALMFAVLAASASYIAVPAALRLALPEANPSLYVPMSLAITFPFNLVIGIPLYHQLIQWL